MPTRTFPTKKSLQAKSALKVSNEYRKTIAAVNRIELRKFLGPDTVFELPSESAGMKPRLWLNENRGNES